MQETLGLYSGSLYEPYYIGVIGPGFLNQVPALFLNLKGLKSYTRKQHQCCPKSSKMKPETLNPNA